MAKLPDFADPAYRVAPPSEPLTRLVSHFYIHEAANAACVLQQPASALFISRSTQDSGWKASLKRAAIGSADT
jgi:hypothetical protein